MVRRIFGSIPSNWMHCLMQYAVPKGHIQQPHERVGNGARYDGWSRTKDELCYPTDLEVGIHMKENSSSHSSQQCMEISILFHQRGIADENLRDFMQETRDFAWNHLRDRVMLLDPEDAEFICVSNVAHSIFIICSERFVEMKCVVNEGRGFFRENDVCMMAFIHEYDRKELQEVQEGLIKGNLDVCAHCKPRSYSSLPWEVHPGRATRDRHAAKMMAFMMAGHSRSSHAHSLQGDGLVGHEIYKQMFHQEPRIFSGRDIYNMLARRTQRMSQQQSRQQQS